MSLRFGISAAALALGLLAGCGDIPDKPGTDRTSDETAAPGDITGPGQNADSDRGRLGRNQSDQELRNRNEINPGLQTPENPPPEEPGGTSDQGGTGGGGQQQSDRQPNADEDQNVPAPDNNPDVE